MKNHDRLTIENKIRDIWAKYTPNKTFDIRATCNNRHNSVDIEIRSDFGPPGLSLHHLCEMSEFFETKHIDVNTTYRPGCDSCDFGAEYTLEFTIKPDNT